MYATIKQTVAYLDELTNLLAADILDGKELPPHRRPCEIRYNFLATCFTILTTWVELQDTLRKTTRLVGNMFADAVKQNESVDWGYVKMQTEGAQAREWLAHEMRDYVLSIEDWVRGRINAETLLCTLRQCNVQVMKHTRSVLSGTCRGNVSPILGYMAPGGDFNLAELPDRLNEGFVAYGMELDALRHVKELSAQMLHVAPAD